MAEINVVPYIDVMLVLLIIFMITAPLLTQGVSVDLPQADAEPLPQNLPAPLVASVDLEGNFYLDIGEDNDQPLDYDTLVNRVAAVLRYKPRTPVMVKGDQGVDYGRVVILMSLLQRAGAPSIGLITEPVPVAASN
jgi:biopolymer transport protein TolR